MGACGRWRAAYGCRHAACVLPQFVVGSVVHGQRGWGAGCRGLVSSRGERHGSSAWLAGHSCSYAVARLGNPRLVIHDSTFTFGPVSGRKLQARRSKTLPRASNLCGQDQNLSKVVAFTRECCLHSFCATTSTTCTKSRSLKDGRQSWRARAICMAHAHAKRMQGLCISKACAWPVHMQSICVARHRQSACMTH
eukprot:364346-Chlamydomonas_euryale.AAC.3